MVKLGAYLQPVKITPVQLLDGLWVAQEKWYQVGETEFLPLESMDAVFSGQIHRWMSPSLHYLYLGLYQSRKNLVVNHPAGFARCE